MLNNKIRENPEEIIKKIDILDYAINKAYTFAKITSDIVGHPVECCGYLISPLFDYSGTVTDVYLAKDQVVSEVHCKLSLDSVFDTENAIKNMIWIISC